ncbi:MAG: D,D-dipeptide ABC transporter permease, partial [Stellaceae bacterium]
MRELAASAAEARLYRALAVTRGLGANRTAATGAAISLLLVLVAAAAPLLAPMDPNAQDLAARLAAPSP